LGEIGQQKLADSEIVLVGSGALGSLQADLLVRAGVGRLRIIDRDYVELSNLQRQCLFTEADAEQGLPKAVAAARRLEQVNSLVEVIPVVADLTPSNVNELLADAKLILDGTDNFETRYLINDFSVLHKIPWVYGAAVGSYGVVMPFVPGMTACLKCIYPEPPAGPQPTCETAGILSSAAAVIAALQVSEAIKILSGHLELVTRKVTTVDVWTGIIRQVFCPERDPNCPACALEQFFHLEGAGCILVSLCGRNAVQIHERRQPLDLAELRSRLAPLGEVRANEFALRFSVPPYEMTVFPDGRAIIKGTTDIGLARSLYARYIGA